MERRSRKLLLLACTLGLAAACAPATHEGAGESTSAQAGDARASDSVVDATTASHAVQASGTSDAGGDRPGTADDAAPKRAAMDDAATADDDAPAPVRELRAFIASKSIDTSKPSWRLRLPKPPVQSFDPSDEYYWVLETSEGTIKARLMPEVAPMHVSSTIYLTELGFYDGLTFHRVIQGFMAQGGCPTGTGGGSPGYRYDGEFRPDVRHDRPGLLSMANAGPGTDGSQFFITFVPTSHLDGKHTIFGEVVEGMDAVRALEAKGSRTGATREPLEILDATITTG